MKRSSWYIWLAVVLIVTSIIIFIANYLIFHNLEEEMFLFMEELAFIPLEVLIVTLIIDRLLGEREKRTRFEKLNMVIGAFFTDVGSKLLGMFISIDSNTDSIRKKMMLTADWEEKEFSTAKDSLSDYQPVILLKPSDLIYLKEFLLQKRDFILRLLENQNLLENESFTDLLWAVSHLNEEISSRKDIVSLAKPDLDHLANDMRRAYIALIGQWLDYMRHLQKKYPYLYSLSVRLNPFNPDAKAEIAS
ncbi:MAG: hypothetical protein OEV21_06350 [Thermoplasmata archaeon]|nr:hypothetical protein [Thermoplasmata archaeon]